MQRHSLPAEPDSRPLSLVGLMAIISGVGLLLGIQRTDAVIEFWGGYGWWALFAVSVYLTLWGVRQSWTSMRTPQWPSRLPRWNRHRMAVTREGVVYIAIMSVMFIGSIIGRQNMLMLVFSMMIGPWVVNGWVAFTMLKQLKVQRHLPRRAMAGELVSVEVELENRKLLLSSWLLAANDQVTHTKEVLQASTLFVRAPARQVRHGQYALRLSQRGEYRFGPIELSTHFPLGLVERSYVCDELGTLLVHPRIGRLTSRWQRDLWNATELAEHRATRAGLFDDEFHRIREFRVGDNPRLIHWRTTARRGDLMVREFHQSREHDLVVLVELWQPAHPTSSDLDRVELAVSFAATVAHEHLRQSRDARLRISVCGKEVLSWDQHTSPTELLDHLAVAEASSAADLQPFVEMEQEGLPSHARLVVISSRTPAEVERRYRHEPLNQIDLCFSTEFSVLAPYFVWEERA